MELTSDQIRAMSDDQLVWCCNQAGISTKPGWGRTKMMDRLMDAASCAMSC